MWFAAAQGRDIQDVPTRRPRLGCTWELSPRTGLSTKKALASASPEASAVDGSLQRKRAPWTVQGHGKSSGAVWDPKAFEGVVIVEPGILGPNHGSVGVDLVEPGYEATWTGMKWANAIKSTSGMFIRETSFPVVVVHR